MNELLKPLKVPKGGKDVYGLAEAYFTSALTGHYRPLDYECYREYEYMGGTAFAPADPTVSILDQGKARVLNMLQGSKTAYGFKFLDPRIKNNQLHDRGFQKPDFLAFRIHNGVIAEVGTSDMRLEKAGQVEDRLRDLTGLVREELKVQSYQNLGRAQPWSGMAWRAAEYLPETGPVLIPVDENRVLSTEPTFSFAKPGVYLYQLYQADGHKLPVGIPVALPKFSPAAIKEAREAWQSKNKNGVGAPTTAPARMSDWPAFEREFKQYAVPAARTLAEGAMAVLVGVAIASALPEEAIGGFTWFVARTIAKAI